MVDGVLAAGGTVILHEHFDPGEVLRAVDTHRVSWAFLAAPHIYQLLDHPDLATTDLSALRQVVYGGCPASPTRLAEAVRVFGPVLRQSYGTTETWGITALTPPEHLEPALLGTVGRPLPGVRVAVRDPDSGRDLAPGETGEVCVRSPSMMDGYWADPDLTATVLRDGWVHTGDLGYLDDRGYLHLVDRIADVIKAGGIKVHPADVEKALTAHPAVAQAAVYGARDADEVEHVYAAVVLRPDATGTTVDDLRTHVAGTLSPRHAPDAITFCAGLPLTGTGKPDKRALRSGG
jgi:fatty-acyl-CoA synthase